jgi:hypothetical protein
MQHNYYVAISDVLGNNWGTQQRSWLRHYATSQKVTGSISVDVIRFYQFT